MHDDFSPLQEHVFLGDGGPERDGLYRLLAQVPMPLSFLMGPEHIFTLVNPATQRLVSDRVLLGKSFREALPEFEGQGFFELMDRVYETGEPYFATESPLWLQRPDGSREELYFNFTYQPIRDAQGKVEGIMQVGFDVTPLVRARQQVERLVSDLEAERQRLQDVLAAEQQAHKEAEAAWQQLEAIFAAMTDGVFVYDAQGHILRMNEAARVLLACYTTPDDVKASLGERAERVKPRSPEGVPLPPEQVPSIRILHGEVLTGDKTADVLVRTFTGEDLLLNMSGAPLRDEQGQISGAIAIARDVTARRRLEHRTQEALDALLTIAEVLVTERLSPLSDLAPTPFMIAGLAHRLLELTCHVMGCENATFVSREPESDVAHLIASFGFTPEQEQIIRATVEGTRFAARYQDRTFLARMQSGEVQLLDFADAPFREQRPLPALQQALVVPVRLEE